tara:strand:- start:2356 stop:2544 length:189 start_codon:yes stop_codon:yes gene_type:complete
MTKYTIHLNYVYETDDHVEVEADNLHDAIEKAEGQSDIAALHADLVHSHTIILDYAEIEEGV